MGNKCKEIQSLLSQYLNRDFSEEEIIILQKHTDICKTCAIKFQNLRKIKNSLINTKKQKVPASVKSSLHERLVEVSVKQETMKKAPWYVSFFHSPLKFGSALAFIMILIGSVLFISTEKDNVTGAQLISQSTVESGKPVTITLEYEATQDIPEATFTISLDEGLAFYSNYAKVNAIKHHSWQGSLKKGINKIPFVVRVEKLGTLNIHTQAEFEQYKHLHRIVLNSEEDKIAISYFIYPKQRIDHAS